MAAFFLSLLSQFEKRCHEARLVTIARQRGTRVMGEAPETGESAGLIIDRPRAAACELSSAGISFEASFARKSSLGKSDVYKTWNSRFDKQI